MWTQVLASTFSYYGNGDKYVASGSFVAYQGRVHEETYRAASLSYEMMNLVKDKPEMSNLYNVGTIMKVLCLARITDCYGDVPYSQALKAKEGITLTEIRFAIKHLSCNVGRIRCRNYWLLAHLKQNHRADLMYGGDVAKWKKFGYSLMLRLAMRLSKVDAAAAKTWAEKAFAGGVFTSIDDNAKVLTDNATNGKQYKWSVEST